MFTIADENTIKENSNFKIIKINQDRAVCIWSNMVFTIGDENI